MHVECLREETLKDVVDLIKERFGRGGLDALYRNMGNPLRRNFPVAGYIVIEKETPIAFEAVILRKVYIGVRECIGRVGGLTCIKEGAPAEAIVDIRTAEKNGLGLTGAKICLCFANSQCRETAAMSVRSRGEAGPDSCREIRERRIRKFRWFCLRVRYWLQRVRRKCFKIGLSKKTWPAFDTRSNANYAISVGNFAIRRLMGFDEAVFNGLMSRYLKTNQGLVLSRTSDELNWLFGTRVQAGSAVLLGAFDKDEIVGYIIVDGGQSARRWRIVDWFALKNDMRILEPLLSAACRFLKEKTPAITLCSEGFPTFVQPLLGKYLPHKTMRSYSVFTWGCGKDKAFREELEKIIDTPSSWFFGPYDGDACY